MTCEGCSGAVSRILTKLGGEDEAGSLLKSSHACARVRVRMCVNNPTLILFYCRFFLELFVQGFYIGIERYIPILLIFIKTLKLVFRFCISAFLVVNKDP